MPLNIQWGNATAFDEANACDVPELRPLGSWSATVNRFSAFAGVGQPMSNTL